MLTTHFPLGNGTLTHGVRPAMGALAQRRGHSDRAVTREYARTGDNEFKNINAREGGHGKSELHPLCFCNFSNVTTLAGKVGFVQIV